MMKLFKHADILNIYPDLKPRTLISWSEKGLLKPAGEPPSGPGTRRQYSTRNLVEIGVIIELVSYGVPHEFISHIMERLAEQDLSESSGFDCVIAASRSHSGYLDKKKFKDSGRYYIFDVRIGARSNFNKEAARLVFGEREWKEGNIKYGERMSNVWSSIVISLADIWEYVKSKV